MTRPGDGRRAIDKLRSRPAIAGRHLLVLDIEWADKRNEAAAALSVAQSRGIGVEDAQAALDVLDKGRDDALIDFGFRRLKPADFQRLMDAHPPTAAQIEHAKQIGGWTATPQWNRDTFPVVVLVASVCEPDLTEEEVREFAEGGLLSAGEVAGLFNAVVAAQTNVARLVE